MTYAIYIITNAVNAKQYVGITSNLKRRWSDHKRANGGQQIHSAIKKYGVESFVFSHIANAFDLEAAQAIERLLIAEHNTKSPFGYNHTDGGDGVVNPSNETKEKIAAKQRGRKHTPEAIAKMALAKTGKISTMKGKTFSSEVRAKMSDARKGKAPPNKGIPMSEETKLKVSASKKGQPSNRKGAVHSEETKAKMALAQKARYAAQKAIKEASKVLS